MTREEIISIAREAGFTSGEIAWHDEMFERFATLVAAAERERIKARNASEIERVNKELRRLHEVNQELLDALDGCVETLAVFVDNGSAAPDSVIGKNLITARAAIAKAGEQP